MNPQAIIQMLSMLFPNSNVGQTISKGQEMIKGVEDSYSGVTDFIIKRGITNEQIDKVATFILTNPKSKQVCGMLRTNPQVIANDIRKLKSDNNNQDPSLAPKMLVPKVNGVKRFTKL